MSEFMGETMYALMPAFYRARDAAQGWPLRALLGLLEKQVMAIEGDIAQMYENWFIETCQSWVVPYIGDLLDVRALRPLAADANTSTNATPLFTQRGYVANTLGYRRRKGTAGVLEQLAKDVAGWPCVAVEFFQLLSTTQHLNHLRLGNLRTVDVRDPAPLELIGGPFETATHTLEVRNADQDLGKYNVPSIGLYLWRLAALELETVVAVKDAGGAGRFRVDPLGADRVLFDRSDLPPSLGAVNREPDMPGPLRRRALYADLEAVRQTFADTGAAGTSSYLGAEPAISITVVGETAPIPDAQIAICDLTSWQLPTTPRTYTRRDGTTVTEPIRVALDPTTGRLAFPAGAAPAQVVTSFSYGFAGPIGGGTFNRVLGVLGNRTMYVVTGGGAQLAAQLTAWAAAHPTSALIEIQDSLTYTLPAALAVPAGLAIEIRAASGQRPVVAAADPTKLWTISLAAASSVTINGIAFAAGLEVDATGDASFALADATLVPGRGLAPDGDPALPGAPSLVATATGGTIAIDIARSIVAGTATIDRCTVFGTSTFTVLSRASDALFTGEVTVDRTQEGCCRFSFVPDGSKVPRAYRCQPRLALDDAAATADQLAIIDRIQPAFTSERYCDPGYAQLEHSTAIEIRLGADNESEMGAFQFLQQPQREANLRSAVQEYLRLGLEAGLFWVT